jgi:hypothetical protein
MLVGDTQLAGRPIEQKLLQAMVAGSAAETLQWINTRVPNGAVVGKPLEDLSERLAQGDWVGASLRKIKDESLKQAKSLVKAAFLSATAPAWFAVAVGIIGGALGFAYEAGEALTTVVIPLILGGGSTLYYLVRAASMSGPALQALGDGASSLVSSTDKIGQSAEAIFSEQVGSPLASLYGSVGARAQLPRALADIRTMAKAIVLLAYSALAIVAVFFVMGAYHAVDLYLNPPKLTCLPGYVELNGQCSRSSLRLPNLNG